MLDHAIAILNDDRIPTSSGVAAIQHINARPEKTQKQYDSLIAELTETAIQPSKDLRHAKYTYLYLVQDIVKAKIRCEPLPPDLYSHAVSTAATFIANNPWIFVEKATPESVDSNGVPKPKKGAKQEAAYEIYGENRTKTQMEVIQIFMKE